MPAHACTVSQLLSPGNTTTGLTLSVISHGHEDCLRTLLTQLARTADGGALQHVIVTHNLPAAPLAIPTDGWPFRLTERHNPQPAGFGTNHNRAFALCDTPFFGVLNPDLEDLTEQLWPRLLAVAALPGVGCAYPLLRNLDGSVQDSERAVPTPLSLWRRYTRRRPERRDWVNAACWVLRSEVWQQLGGFDEGYFLYCEDVDFCLRLQLAGYRLERAATELTHHAQRSSHRRLRYVALHLGSLWRLWRTAPFYRFRSAQAAGRLPQP